MNIMSVFQLMQNVIFACNYYFSNVFIQLGKMISERSCIMYQGKIFNIDGEIASFIRSKSKMPKILRNTEKFHLKRVQQMIRLRKIEKGNT